MSRRILVTGGAGFIGSHLVDRLIADGHEVTVLDAMVPQVHSDPPRHLNGAATYIRGDVRDRVAMKAAIADKDVIYHQAAELGLGRSMYEIERFVSVNTMATALLLDLLVNTSHSVKKLIVASSMSLYGEGAYVDEGGNLRSPPARSPAQMERHEWELRDLETGSPLRPIPTPESKPLDSTSVYALSKKDQEEYALVVGRAYGLPIVALRYFNTYGPRQSLNNPYTGVCAIFSSRIKNGNPPIIYEDGLQSRDFVAVEDVVQANVLAMERSGADYQAINVGTGHATTVAEVARILAELYDRPSLQPIVAQKFRAGDIRHCHADISKARKLLGYEPQVTLAEGMRQLVSWAHGETAVDNFDRVVKELAERKLTIG